MKTIILASGMGIRLAPHIVVPKCLIPVRGTETILDMQLSAFRKHGIDEFIITTGHRAEEIRDFMAAKYGDLKCTFVHNAQYAETNYIYSLHLCRGHIDGDIVLVHGDLVFDERVLPMLLKTRSSSVVLKRRTAVSNKDFKGIVKKGVVKRISVTCSGPNAFPLAPLYKLVHSDASAWMQRIAQFVGEGRVSCYAEDALNEMLSSVHMEALFFPEGTVCDEIDTFQNLQAIRSQLRREGSGRERDFSSDR